MRALLGRAGVLRLGPGRPRISRYRIGKLPEPDYYAPNPVDERYAPARLWTESTLRQAGVELSGTAAQPGPEPPEAGIAPGGQ